MVPQSIATQAIEADLTVLRDTAWYAVKYRDFDSGSSVHYARAGSSPASRTKQKTP